MIPLPPIGAGVLTKSVIYGILGTRRDPLISWYKPAIRAGVSTDHR